MSSELPADVNPYQIEPELTAYAPRPPRIDRDRLMFEAGRAAEVSHPAASAALSLRPGAIAWFPPAPQSPPPMNWLWPASTMAMTVVAVGLGLALLVRPVPLERVQVVERVVRIPSHAPQAVPQPLAVSSGHRDQANHDFAGPAAEDEAPVLTLESLPENHVLRIRQVALTQDIDALAPPVSSDTARLTPLPTRGSLMRKLAAPPAAAATKSAPLFRWSDWFSQPQQPAM
ncbi:MAG TPA: hypothetical protein VMP01_27785 [Pirellulaceae bacterium]|nr:hypothetical protein [Pirellulaceae bacterium]